MLVSILSVSVAAQDKFCAEPPLSLDPLCDKLNPKGLADTIYSAV